MVERDVEDDRYSALVALFDESLEVVGGSVILIGRHHKHGVVAPAFVAFKLHDGHQLNGIDAQAVEIVHSLNESIPAVRGVKIAEQELVNHQIALIEAVKLNVGIPVKANRRGFENAHRMALTRGISRAVGKGGIVYGAIVPGIEHQGRIGVGHSNSVDIVLKPIGNRWAEIVELDPEELPVRTGVHAIGRGDLPIVEVAHGIDGALSRSPELEMNRCLREYGDAFFSPRGHRNRQTGGDVVPYGIIMVLSRINRIENQAVDAGQHPCKIKGG